MEKVYVKLLMHYLFFHMIYSNRNFMSLTAYVKLYLLFHHSRQ
jgi:hypothetical protein